METLIDVQELNFIYGEGALQNHVLKNVNIKLNKGEIVILTGPSGSGKTTLLTIIGALRRAEEGSVRVFGKELVGAPESLLNETRLSTGYIFQQHNLLKSLTAEQNVCMSLELREGLSERERQKKARAILEKVGLGHRLHHKTDQLSGGERQRVSVARALVAQPKLVLADEPTASLDKNNGMEVVEILKELAREQGTTILLVTHDYRILDVADRVVELEDGKIQTSDKKIEND